MSDERLRALERAARAGDPSAQAELQRWQTRYAPTFENRLASALHEASERVRFVNRRRKCDPCGQLEVEDVRVALWNTALNQRVHPGYSGFRVDGLPRTVGKRKYAGARVVVYGMLQHEHQPPAPTLRREALTVCDVCGIEINDENGAPCGVCGDAFCFLHYGDLSAEECRRCRGGSVADVDRTSAVILGAVPIGIVVGVSPVHQTRHSLDIRQVFPGIASAGEGHAGFWRWLQDNGGIFATGPEVRDFLAPIGARVGNGDYSVHWRYYSVHWRYMPPTRNTI